MRLDNFHQFNESLKNDRLNDLLGKISAGQTLSDSEKKFLDNYESISDDDLRDYTHLSISEVYDKVGNLLDKNKKVLYKEKELEDVRYIKDDICLITFSDIIKLKDNFSYSILHNEDDSYTVVEQDEFFEKQPLSND